MTDFSTVRMWGPLAYLTPPVLLIHIPLAAIVLLVAAYVLRSRNQRHNLPAQQRLALLLLGGCTAAFIVVAGMSMFPGPMRPFRLTTPGQETVPDVASTTDWIVHLIAPLGLMLAALGFYAITAYGLGRELATSHYHTLLAARRLTIGLIGLPRLPEPPPTTKDQPDTSRTSTRDARPD